MKKLSTLLFMWLVFFLTDIYSGEGKPDKLLVAALHRREAEVKELLQAGASLGQIQDSRFIQGFTPLVAAVLGGSLPVVKVFLEQGADPNEGVYATPLIALANLETCNELPQMVDYLVEKGADVNKPNCLGITPFMVLVAHESTEMNSLGWHLAVLGGICPSLSEMKASASSILVTRGLIKTMTRSSLSGVDRVTDVKREVAQTDYAEQLKKLLDQEYPKIRASYLKVVASEKEILSQVFIPKCTDREIPKELQNLILSMNRGEQI